MLFAVYEFVGVFGATTLVGLLKKLFEGILNPAMTEFINGFHPRPWLQNCWSGWGPGPWA